MTEGYDYFGAGAGSTEGNVIELDLARDKKAAKALVNLEAEQALIGATLNENEAFHQVPPTLAAEHFAEPFHQRLWRVIAAKIGQGVLVEPIMLREQFRADPSFTELGGLQYLLSLIDHAPPAAHAAAYAEIVIDLATKRKLVALADHIRNQLVEGRDVVSADDALADAERQLLGIKATGTEIKMVGAAEASDEVMAYIDQDPATAEGVYSGLEALDRMVGPALPGDLILLGGRPGMGKSTVEGNWVLNIAGPHLSLLGSGGADLAFEDRWRAANLPPQKAVLKISLEMPIKQTTWRMLTDIAFRLYGTAAPTYSQIRKRELTEAHRVILREAKAHFDALPVVQIKRTGLRMGQLRSIIRRQKIMFAGQGYDLGMVSLDHAGLAHPDVPTRSEYEAQSYIAKAAKEIAGECEVPLLMLNQLSRDVERRDDKRPTMADLRASGQFEENADMVLLAYRDAYYARKEKMPKTEVAIAELEIRRASKDLELIGAKVRDSPEGDARMWCDIGHHAVRSHEPGRDPGRLV